MIIGEAGIPEMVEFNAAGRVHNLRELLFRTPAAAGMGGTINYNNQTTMGGITFPDPRGVPPIYIKMMENISARIVKKALAGRVG